MDDNIDFKVTDSRVADHDIDFNETDSRVVDDECDIDFTVTYLRIDNAGVDFNITDSKVITNNNAKAAATKISQKYKNIRQKKVPLKLPSLRDKDKTEIKDLSAKKMHLLALKRLVKSTKK